MQRGGIQFVQKKQILIKYILSFSIILFLYACSFDSPTAPSPPVKKAAIKIEVNLEPIPIIYRYSLGYGVATPKVTISEVNGVGINLEYILVEFDQSPTVESKYFQARRLDSHGSFTLSLYMETLVKDNKYLVVTTKGTDDNSYKIEKISKFYVSYTFY